MICYEQCLQTLLGIIGQNSSSVSMSSWLHVGIFWFPCINSKYIPPQIPLTDDGVIL